MRIAYVCTDAGIPVFGCKGASVHVQGIVRALLRAAHDVTLFAARVGEAPPVWADGLAVVPLNLAVERSAYAHAQWISAMNASLVTALREAGPFDCVYERYALWSYGGMEFARSTRVPGILEVNAPLIEEQATHRMLHDRGDAERVAGRAFHAASSIVAVSAEVATYVNDNPCSGGRAVVEPNGVDPDRFRGRRPAGGAPFTMGFVGTLKPWHGLTVLADAFALVRQAVPDARLLIVGTGPGREALRVRLAEHHAEDAAVFAGAVPPDQVNAWLQRMDVALAPYPADGTFYFSPLKIVEYQAAGVPVVASAIGQIRDLVSHGVTGLLVSAGDAPGFALACLSIHSDPQHGAAMAEAARARVLGTRSWDAVMERILSRAFTAAPARVHRRLEMARVLI